jgi:membrane protease YdiL (CAAX protease family)
VVVRVVLVGITILLAGIGPWPVLVSLNLRVASSLPWSAAIQLAILGVLWWYLGGGGRPAVTADSRRRNLRANAVRGQLLAWSVTAGALFAGGVVALSVTGWLLIPVPAASLDQFTSLANYSLWMTVPMLLTGSCVAGVVEEAAFRGYMQVPLERQYGPATAIGIVAVLFTLAHLPSPIAWPGFLLAAVGWGALAYLSNSILPGVVFHTAVDAVTWVWALWNIETFERVLTSHAGDGGSAAPLILSAALTLVLGIAATLAFYKLATIRAVERHAV